MINNFIIRTITSILMIVILLLGLFHSDFSWKALVLLFSSLCFFEFFNLINKASRNKIFKTILVSLIFLYLVFFSYLLILTKITLGEEMLLILISTCILSDVGGYVTGNLIGGPKLTNISPNKTISGSLGSIIFTIAGTTLFIFFLKKINNDLLEFDISLKSYLWMIMMSLFCQTGDLIVSLLKRKANLKDTGKLLPGHGGILDRVDGMILAIPLGTLTYFILLQNS